MALNDPKSVLERVTKALKQEQKLIRKGEFTELPALVEARERDLAGLQIDKAQLSPQFTASVAKVKRLAHLNGVLLEAAIEGARDAERRLNEIKAAAEALGTYDKDGQKSETPVVNPGVQLRA